ncbi:unnamed protein product [Macrosiphum euphorbiae]|nr:unnamed protein product [Macrosiphum euphorbiae]
MGRNIISRRKRQTLGSSPWVEINGPHRQRIAGGVLKTYRKLEETSRRLQSRLNYMVSKARSVQDIQLRYAALKEKVADTEQMLLLNGIDTSEYPVFREVIPDIEEDRDSDCEIIDDIKSEIIPECEMNAENCIHLDGQDFNLRL